MRTVAMAACLLVALSPAAAPARTADDSHQRMIDLLATLAERQPLREARDQQVEQLRTRLFQLRRAVSDAQRAGIRRGLGMALLSAGEPYEALDNFDQMLRETRVLSASASLPVTLGARFWQGATHLHLAEIDNCGASGAPERCRYPMDRPWEPGTEDWSAQALESLRGALHLATPGSEIALATRWLLHVAAAAAGTELDGIAASVRADPRAFSETVPAVPRLADAAREIGLAVPALSGGLVIDDLDGDGWLDVVTSSADLQAQVRVHRNDGGSFQDVTEESGLAGITGGHNLVHADYDGDGDLDILVLRGGWLADGGSQPNSLLRNDGNFIFTDVTFDVGLGEDVYPTQAAAWADYDSDGDLDLFVGNDADPDAGFASQLYRNDDGTFTEVGAASGARLLGRIKGVAWGDVDGDGWPDLFVSVLGADNVLLRNERDGTFRDITASAGVAAPTSSHSTWFWDADGDGHQDLLVSSSRLAGGPASDVWYWFADLLGLPHPAERLHLYLGDGTGRFTESAAGLGIDRVTLGTGGSFGDLDDDGRLDVFLATGYSGYDSLIPDVLFLGREGGFVDATYTAGVGDIRRGAAVAFADFDNDGDQDLFVKRGSLLPDDAIADSVFQNPGMGNHSLSLELRGERSNRFAVGARVRAVVDGPRRRILTRWVGPGGSFGSGPLRVHLGLGEAAAVSRLEVYWPTSGETQVFANVEAGSRVLIREGSEQLSVLGQLR